MEKNRLMEALNRIDELACAQAEGDREEAERLERDYTIMADLIDRYTGLFKAIKKYAIAVNIGTKNGKDRYIDAVEIAVIEKIISNKI